MAGANIGVSSGNSSSGLVEAPAFPVATVNIGPRQDGRLKASSIVDCTERREAIVAAINEVMSAEFQRKLPATQSLYGNCQASTAIRETLATAPLPPTLAKVFHDI